MWLEIEDTNHKIILKRDKKCMESNGKGLTFGPECVPTKKKVGHFLLGIVSRAPSAKRQKFSKHFSCKTQTFIKLTVAGNMYVESRNAAFFVKIRQLIQVLMNLESRLVVLFYPVYVSTAKCRPFVNDTSMSSSISKARQYVNKIWVKEEMPTIVKVFVGHDLPAAAFNSIKFAKATDDIDGTVLICVIQASKTVKTGYLLSSRKTRNNRHWDLLFNNHPKLNKMDVKVSSHPIKDLTSGS